MSKPTQNEQAEQLTREALATVLVKHRKQLLKALSKAGVPLSESASDDEVIVATLSAVKGSRSFRTDLANLLSWAYRQGGAGRQSEGKSADEIMHATGHEQALGLFGPDDVSTTSTTPTASTTTATTTSTTTTSSGLLSGFLDRQKLDTLFNTGISVLNSKLTADANKASELRALELEQERTKQMMLAVQAKAVSGAATEVKPTLSTGAKVAIGLGAAAVLGTVIFLIVKSKKK